MPLPRQFNRCLLRPQDFKPSRADLEVIGAFNPGAAWTSEGVVLLVRIAERAREQRSGHTPLPRWDERANGVVLDWEPSNTLTPVDIRAVRRQRDGLVRLNFISHLRVVYSTDGRSIDPRPGAWFAPANAYEEFGVEDPRITRLGDTYFFTYVAVSRHGAATALASTKDFQSFERHGIIFPPENKDVVLFPEKIGGRYQALHRPNGATPFTRPEMWVSSSTDLLHWGGHEYFLGGTGAWDVGRIGAGPPPIRTAAGWLELYHGNSRRQTDSGIGAYAAGALLLELENPRRILRAVGELFQPESEYERSGFVPDVVFPTGIVEQSETVLVYYGAADTCSAVVEFSRTDLMASLLP